MKKIPIEEAFKEYGISTLHTVYDSGEARFRLKKSDGTAYIRTEAGESGAWQQSHYHKNVSETYIVQSGWIAFAQEKDQQFSIQIYNEGEIFTTESGVIHNVFMPPSSVIHTVKHGNCLHDDRLTDGTKQFNSKCKKYESVSEILAFARKGKTQNKSDETYTSEYRHFDNLIWQAPSWGAAIFALSLSVVGSKNLQNFAQNVDLTESSVTFSVLLMLSLTLFSLSFVNYRFRVHQKSLKRYSNTPFWKSASTISQLAINAQATFLFSLSLMTLNVLLPITYSISIVLLFSVSLAMERILRFR